MAERGGQTDNGSWAKCRALITDKKRQTPNALASENNRCGQDKKVSTTYPQVLPAQSKKNKNKRERERENLR